MGRTGTQENKDANTQASAWQKQGFDTAQKGVSDYNANVKTLEAGGNVGKNPFLDPNYLANQNKLEAYATEGGKQATGAAIERNDRQTGGLNTGSTQASVRDLGIQSLRASDQLKAQRAAGDYGNNLAWQQYLAQAPLQTTAAESPYFGTATSQRVGSLDNLQKIGQASYGPWNALISAAGGAAGAVGGGFAARG